MKKKNLLPTDRPIFTLDDHLKELMENPKFKKEWEESEAEYQLACKLIEAIRGNPSLSLLERIAHALGTKIQISFS